MFLNANLNEVLLFEPIFIFAINLENHSGVQCQERLIVTTMDGMFPSFKLNFCICQKRNDDGVASKNFLKINFFSGSEQEGGERRNGQSSRG